MSPEHLIAAAADLTQIIEDGGTVPASTTSLLRAITSTRSEAERHALAAAAEARLGSLGDTAIQFLRVAIFALA